MRKGTILTSRLSKRRKYLFAKYSVDFFVNMVILNLIIRAYRADGVVWFHPALEKFPCEIGIKDHGDTRGVKVFFKTPITGLQHTFMPTETFAESYDLETGITLGYSIK